MKVTIGQGDLNKWLTLVSRIVPSRGQLPVLSNVLLEADKEGLTISGTNLEIGMRVNAGGKVNEEGNITVTARSLGEFVSSLPDGNTILETTGDKLKISGGKLEAIFAGIPATEFPVIARVGDDKKAHRIKFKKKIIEETATEVAFAAATDESRPVLTGVRFETDEKKMSITATDGFRLSRKVIVTEGKSEGWEKTIILPARTILEMAKIITEGKKEEAEMIILKESNQVIFEYNDIVLTSRILEGNYPEVEKIIPTDSKIEIIVDRQNWLRAVKAVGVFARESANVIKIKISDGKMIVEASSSQMGEGRDEIEIETEKGKNEEGTIAFNYRYLLDFLNSTGEERIKFKMTDGLAPGKFEVGDKSGLIHLIMPVRV